MKTFLVICLLSLGMVRLPAAESDAEVNARKTALDLAGAFFNDGFKARDGHWSGDLKQGQRTLVAVNLYAGNQYWFTAGASAADAKVTVEIFDENGQKMQAENYDSADQAAAGFSPTNSGQYFVGVTLSSAKPVSVCLVCSYK